MLIYQRLKTMPKTVGVREDVSYAPTEEKSLYDNFLPPVFIGGFFISKAPFGNSKLEGGNKMAKVELKQPIVEEISAGIKDAQSVVLVDYRGLTVAQDTELRKALREAGVTYKVYKNTMVNFAIKGTAFEGLAPYLEGPSAMAYSSTDATAPARVLAEFAKKADKLELKGGVVDGTVYDANGIKTIASIPSREVLISRLLGSMQSPITNFARVMNQLAEKGGAAACDAPVKEETPAEEAPAAEVVEAVAVVTAE